MVARHPRQKAILTLRERVRKIEVGSPRVVPPAAGGLELALWQGICAVDSSSGIIKLADTPVMGSSGITSPGAAGPGSGTFYVLPNIETVMFARIVFSMPAQPIIANTATMHVSLGVSQSRLPSSVPGASNTLSFPGHVFGHVANFVTGTMEAQFTIPLLNFFSGDVYIVMRAQVFTPGDETVTLPATVFAIVAVEQR